MPKETFPRTIKEQQELHPGKVRNINDIGFIVMQAGRCPFWIGDPGCAKTSVVSQFARFIGRNLHIVRGQTDESVDILGSLRVGEYKGREIQSYLPAEWIVKAELDPENWIIFFDELTCVPELTQAALLQPIGERRCKNIQLPPGLMMCAVGNDPKVAAAGVELPPPMVSRLVWLEWQLDPNFWLDGFIDGLKWEDHQWFTILPDDWKEWIPPAAGQIGAFLKHEPVLFSRFPRDNHVLQRQPYPCQRTWQFAAETLAALMSVEASESEIAAVLGGCVGEGVASQYMTWQQEMDLPDPQEAFRNALEAWSRGAKFEFPTLDRSDKVLSFCSAIAGTARHCDLSQPHVWETAVAYLSEIGKNFGRDIAVPALKQVLNDMPKGAKAPPIFVREYMEIFNKLANEYAAASH